MIVDSLHEGGGGLLVTVWEELAVLCASVEKPRLSPSVGFISDSLGDLLQSVPRILSFHSWGDPCLVSAGYLEALGFF